MTHDGRAALHDATMERLANYSSPRAANESALVPATMTWSSRRTATSASASGSRRVTAISAGLGSRTPLGCLWATINALQLCLRTRSESLRTRVHRFPSPAGVYRHPVTAGALDRVLGFEPVDERGGVGGELQCFFG